MASDTWLRLATGGLGPEILGIGGGGGGGGFSPTNPSFGVLNSLFGMKLHKHKHGDDAGQTSLVRDKKNPGLFGEQFARSVNDFMFNPPKVSQGETDLYNQVTGMAPGLLSSAMGEFDSLIGRQKGLLDNGYLSKELMDTGFNVDVNPLFETARNQFSRNVLPEIAERMGMTSGIGSQGFIDTAGREGANLLDSAALAGVDMSNQAAGRRASAHGLDAQLRSGGMGNLATLLGARTALPFSVGSDTLNLGTQYRNILDSYAARPLGVFSQLAGLGGPGTQGFMVPGFNPQGSGTANLLGSLASSLPSLIGLATGNPAAALPGLGKLAGGF